MELRENLYITMEDMFGNEETQIVFDWPIQTAPNKENTTLQLHNNTHTIQNVRWALEIPERVLTLRCRLFNTGGNSGKFFLQFRFRTENPTSVALVDKYHGT